jgi:hypothetical protein
MFLARSDDFSRLGAETTEVVTTDSKSFSEKLYQALRNIDDPGGPAFSVKAAPFSGLSGSNERDGSILPNSGFA